MRAIPLARCKTVYLGALLALGAAGADIPGQSPPAPLTLGWCLERAFQASPEIAISSETAAAARARVDYVGAFDDPRFGYEASNLPVDDLDFDSTPLSGHQLAIRQKIPFPGLLSSRKGAARAGAAAADQQVIDRRRRVASAVEVAWAELGFAQRALGITDRNLTLLRQLAKIAESRYRVGVGLQQDVLRAQVEVTGLLEERLRRQAAVVTAAARLAALLDLSGEEALPDTSDLDDAAPVPELSQLLAQLDERSPLLQALLAKISEAERLHRAAQLEGYPDFDLNAGYRIRERVLGDPVRGDDFVSAGITIRLPINRSKWRGRVAEQAALVRRAKARHRAGRARLHEQLRSAHAQLQRADEEIRLVVTGLLPQTRQSLESSRSGYEVGRVDFPSVLDTQVRLLQAELRRVRALADRRTAFAALEAATGEALR